MYAFDFSEAIFKQARRIWHLSILRSFQLAHVTTVSSEAELDTCVYQLRTEVEHIRTRAAADALIRAEQHAEVQRLEAEVQRLQTEVQRLQETARLAAQGAEEERRRLEADPNPGPAPPVRKSARLAANALAHERAAKRLKIRK